LKKHFAAAALAAAALTLASGANAATCQVVAAAGDGPSKDVATFMAAHGLENLIEHKGLKGQGPVKTRCVPGAMLTECTSQQKACK
jgi:hypothetical protein